MFHAARIFGALVACAFFAGNALAQNYPSRAIRVIVPQQPGDPCDTFARLLGPYMTKTSASNWSSTTGPAPAA